MNEYQRRLKNKMDEYVHFVYKITKEFPKSELYGVVSQIRRSSLSIILNYIEGYTREKPLVRLNFFEMSYGYLVESDYLLDFSYKENYLQEENYYRGKSLSKEIGAMLWTEISNLKKALSDKKITK